MDLSIVEFALWRHPAKDYAKPSAPWFSCARDLIQDYADEDTSTRRDEAMRVLLHLDRVLEGGASRTNDPPQDDHTIVISDAWRLEKKP